MHVRYPVAVVLCLCLITGCGPGVHVDDVRHVLDPQDEPDVDESSADESEQGPAVISKNKTLEEWIALAESGPSPKARQEAVDVLQHQGLQHDREETISVFTGLLSDNKLKQYAAKGIRRAGRPADPQAVHALNQAIAAELSREHSTDIDFEWMKDVFRALAASCDESQIPVLESWSTHTGAPMLIKQYAQMAIEDIRNLSAGRRLSDWDDDGVLVGSRTGNTTPFNVNKSNSAHKTRPADEILRNQLSNVAIVGREFVVDFRVPLTDVDYSIGSASDAVNWKQPLPELQVSATSEVLPLNAAVTNWQNLMYMSEEGLKNLAAHQLPIPVRLGRERMEIVELDDYTWAAKVSRSRHERSWHDVTEQLVIVADRNTDNAAYYAEGKALLQEQETFSWIPTANDVGERRLRLRWREKRSPYQGALDIMLNVGTVADADQAEVEQLAAKLQSTATPWRQTDVPRNSSGVVGRDEPAETREVRRLLASTRNSRSAKTIPVVAISASDEDGKLNTNIITEFGDQVQIDHVAGNGVPLLELPNSVLLTTERDRDFNHDVIPQELPLSPRLSSLINARALPRCITPQAVKADKFEPGESYPTIFPKLSRPGAMTSFWCLQTHTMYWPSTPPTGR